MGKLYYNQVLIYYLLLYRDAEKSRGLNKLLDNKRKKCYILILAILDYYFMFLS